MYDIAIIGAGPAGTTLARLLGRRYRILLVDRRNPGDASGSHRATKCCGGLLAPDAQKMLSVLGLGLPKNVLEDPQLFVVKAIDLQQGLERDYQRHYVNMDRRRFDAWLLSLVPSEVDTRTDSRLESLSREGNRLTLTLAAEGTTYTEHARIVVGADGAHSIVRRRLFADRPFPKEYFGIQEHFEADDHRPHFTSLFDREITDYYCWTIPKEGELIVGAAVYPKHKAVEKLDLLKTKLARRGFTLGRTIRREGALIFRPVRADQICTGERGVALVGEAAGWISPSSAEGLSYAMRSAVLLAESMAETTEGFERRYRRLTGRLRRGIMLKNLKSTFIFNPRLRQVIMRSGIHSMEMRRES